MKSSRHCSPFRTREVKHPVSATNQPSKKKKKRLAAHSNDLIVGINRLKRCGKHSLRRIAPPSLHASLSSSLPAFLLTRSRQHRQRHRCCWRAGVHARRSYVCGQARAPGVCTPADVSPCVFGEVVEAQRVPSGRVSSSFSSFRRSTSGSPPGHN